MGIFNYISVIGMVLVSGTIAAVIWTTVFLNNRRSGWILLAVLIFFGATQMVNSFLVSPSIGLTVLIIYLGLGILSIQRIKSQQAKEASGNPR